MSFLTTHIKMVEKPVPICNGNLFLTTWCVPFGLNIGSFAQINTAIYTKKDKERELHNNSQKHTFRVKLTPLWNFFGRDLASTVEDIP